MIELGKINRLQVSRIGAFDIYLNGGDAGEVLLLDDGSSAKPAIGDKQDVFVYLDADQTLMATPTVPRVLAGSCASLNVVALTHNGAFLDWGLKSDLFVPRSEQLGEMSVGSRCVAYAMVDKDSQRMIASTRLYKYLPDENDNDFKPGQPVKLLISQQTDLGYKAVIDGTHLGVLYNNEIFTDIKVGAGYDGFIKPLRDDKKIDLALQKIGTEARSEIEIKILSYLQKNNGESTLTDKSPPEEIYKTFGVSKKAYKNALGGMYRNRLITITKEKITLV